MYSLDEKTPKHHDILKGIVISLLTLTACMAFRHVASQNAAEKEILMM